MWDTEQRDSDGGCDESSKDSKLLLKSLHRIMMGDNQRRRKLTQHDYQFYVHSPFRLEQSEEFFNISQKFIVNKKKSQ